MLDVRLRVRACRRPAVVRAAALRPAQHQRRALVCEVTLVEAETHISIYFQKYIASFPSCIVYLSHTASYSLQNTQQLGVLHPSRTRFRIKYLLSSNHFLLNVTAKCMNDAIFSKLRQSVLAWRLTSLSPAKAQAGARQCGGPTRWLGRRRTTDKPRRLRIIGSISHWYPRLWLPTDNNYLWTV